MTATDLVMVGTHGRAVRARRAVPFGVVSYWVVRLHNAPPFAVATTTMPPDTAIGVIELDGDDTKPETMWALPRVLTFRFAFTVPGDRIAIEVAHALVRLSTRGVIPRPDEFGARAQWRCAAAVLIDQAEERVSPRDPTIATRPQSVREWMGTP